MGDLMYQDEAWDTMQAAVGKWADKTFKKSTPTSVLNHLDREIRELRAAENAGRTVGDEVADCVLLLLHYAHKKGISVHAECVKKHRINEERKWGKPDAEGVVEHIE